MNCTEIKKLLNYIGLAPKKALYGNPVSIELFWKYNNILRASFI
jgi:hypothetical protein